MYFKLSCQESEIVIALLKAKAKKVTLTEQEQDLLVALKNFNGEEVPDGE